MHGESDTMHDRMLMASDPMDRRTAIVVGARTLAWITLLGAP